MIKALSQTYRGPEGKPTLTRVETSIFTRTYFTHCTRCDFCHSGCCALGAEVAPEEQARIEAHADAIEAFTGVPRSDWFEDQRPEDVDEAWGPFRCTQVAGAGCVFLKPGMGCALHGFALARGMDYHTVKPMVCSLFPLSFDSGLLGAGHQVREDELICLGEGETLYRGIRDELLFYFGRGLVDELDALEADVMGRPKRGAVTFA